MSLYERGHGAHGEGMYTPVVFGSVPWTLVYAGVLLIELSSVFSSGGAKGGIFHSRRYATGSGLNSSNLDFLPVRNIEDMDVVLGGVTAVPVGKFPLYPSFCIDSRDLYSLCFPFYRGRTKRSSLAVGDQRLRVPHVVE